MSRRGPAQASGTPRHRSAQPAGQAEAQRLQELQNRTERAERRLLACENLVGELGSNLAALGSLLQDYGHLQQRLDNVENLLKNRNFWILRLPPSSRGEVPKVPVTFDDISVYFNEQEWARLERWQKDLYRAVMRGNYETLVSLDYAVSKPDILSRMEKDEELCSQDSQELSWTCNRDAQEPPEPRTRAGQEPPQAPEEMDQMEEPSGAEEVPMEADPDYTISKPDILSCMEDEELCSQDAQEPPQAHVGDVQKPPQAHVGDVQKPPQAHVGDVQKPPQAHVGDVQKPPQAHVGDVQKPPQAHVGDVQKPPQAHVGDVQKPPQAHVGDVQKPPQAHVGDVQKLLQTGVAESQKPPQTNVPGDQKHLQASVRDGQEAPQTGVTDGPKPQAPEDMSQKKETLREDKVPVEGATEMPVLVMNITSLSAQEENLCRKDQPETEMDEDSAESGTEGGFSPEDEMACEGAPPANVKVKKEPEASQDASIPSPGPEIQKCPKTEQAKTKSKKKPSRCETSSLLMGNCRRGYVREWSHPCTECGKRFRLKINLIIHQRSHAKEGPYECPMCEISFADRQHLDLHQSIHVKDRAFGAKFWGNVHPELRIRPRRKFCGALCGGTHGQGGGTCAGGTWPGQPKEELERGSPSGGCISRQPSPKSPRKSMIKCYHCKKMLSCAVSLQRHLRTHLRERPYCCSACQKCFTRRTHLLRHEKIHDREKALEAALQQPLGAAAAPERSASPTGKAAPDGAVPLAAPGGTGQGCAGRAAQPTVRLGNRAGVLAVTEK